MIDNYKLALSIRKLPTFQEQVDQFNKSISLFNDLQSTKTKRLFKHVKAKLIDNSWRIIMLRVDTNSTFDISIDRYLVRLNENIWKELKKMPKRKLEL